MRLKEENAAAESSRSPASLGWILERTRYAAQRRPRSRGGVDDASERERESVCGMERR